MKHRAHKFSIKFTAVLAVFALAVSCSSPESQSQRFIQGMIANTTKKAKLHQSNPKSPFKEIKIYQVGRTLGVIFEFTLKDPALLEKIDPKVVKQRYLTLVKRSPEAKRNALKEMFDRGLYILYRYKKPDGQLGLEIRIDKNDKW